MLKMEHVQINFVFFFILLRTFTTEIYVIYYCVTTINNE